MAVCHNHLDCCSCELLLCWVVARKLVGELVGCNRAVGLGNRWLVAGIGQVADLGVGTGQGIAGAVDIHAVDKVEWLVAVVAYRACSGSLVVVVGGSDSCSAVALVLLGLSSY